MHLAICCWPITFQQVYSTPESSFDVMLSWPKGADGTQLKSVHTTIRLF